MVSPYIGFFGVLALLVVVLVVVRWVMMRDPLHADGSRKVVHVLMGSIALSFPWLFGTIQWPVIVLAALSIVVLSGCQWIPVLRRQWGAVLFSSENKGYAEWYFPIAVAVVFCLSGDQLVFYLIPILITTVSYAMVPLIGASYGRSGDRADRSGENKKNIEGLFVFFMVSLISTLSMLLVYTQIGRIESLFLAILVGLLVSLIEVVSFRGSDYFLVPVLGYVFLVTHVDRDMQQLLLSLCLMLVLLLFLTLWERHGLMNKSGNVTVLLGSYLIITLLGWQWYVAPLLFFLLYGLFPSVTEAEKKRALHQTTINSYLFVGMMWLVVAALMETHQMIFYWGFVGAFVCQFVIVSYVRVYVYVHPRTRWRPVGWAMGKGLLLLLPALLVHPGVQRWNEVAVEIGLLCVALLASVVYTAVVAKKVDLSSPYGWVEWMHVAFVLLLTAMLVAYGMNLY